MTEIKNMDLENRDVAKQKNKDGRNNTADKNNRLIRPTPSPNPETVKLMLEVMLDMKDAEGWMLMGENFAAIGNLPMAELSFGFAAFYVASALGKIWRATHPYTEKDHEEFKAAMEKTKDPAYPYGDDLRRPPTWEIPYPEIERRELFPWEETNAAKGIAREARGGEKGLVGMRMALQAQKDKLKALAKALQITPSFLREKFMTEQTNLDGLQSSFPQPGQLPQDHIPLEMQVTRDKNLEIYDAANPREGVVEEPRRVRQTRGGSKGPDVTKFRSDPSPAYTPPTSSEFILPTERSQNQPPKYRFSGPFTALSPAAMAALTAPEHTPPAAGAAASGGPQVIINGILPPPTRLADEDFKRCLQREINKLVIDFETGVRG